MDSEIAGYQNTNCNTWWCFGSKWTHNRDTPVLILMTQERDSFPKITASANFMMAFDDGIVDTADTADILALKPDYSQVICSYLFGMGATWTIQDPDFKIVFIWTQVEEHKWTMPAFDYDAKPDQLWVCGSMPLCDDYVANENFEPYTNLSSPNRGVDSFNGDDYQAGRFFKYDPVTRILTYSGTYTSSFDDVTLTYEVLDSNPRAFIEVKATQCVIGEIN